MKLLTITGASGFVGKNLLTYLSNYSIDSLSRNDLNVVSNDIFGDSTAIVHLAGKAHDLKKTSHPDEYYQVNFDLTKKLYNEFLKSDAKKFIFISSVKAVADIVGDVLTEDTVPNPQTHYGKSKLMAEEYIKSLPLPEGKSYYILRPCMIHGPGNKGNLNLLYQFVKKGVPYPLAAFKNKRSFLSVENLCFVIKFLLEENIQSGTYNVADDEPLSTNEVVSVIASCLNKKVKLWNVNPSLIILLAKLGDYLKLPLNTDRLNKLTQSYIVSNNKLKKTLNFSLPTTSRHGLNVTITSFK